MASRKPSTSSDALTINVNEEVNTVSTVKVPYIILNSNTIEDNKADKVMIEAKVDNALISTQSEAEALLVPWIDQEWWNLPPHPYL